MTLAACVFALLGFALLALSQERHLERVFESNRPPAQNIRAQRAIGFIAIGSNLPICISTQGASFGSLLWLMLICAAAMAVALTLTWRPGWLRSLCYLLAPPWRGANTPQTPVFNSVKGKLP